MYTIYADGQLVYAPTLSAEGYAAASPKAVVELNRAGSAQSVGRRIEGDANRRLFFQPLSN